MLEKILIELYQDLLFELKSDEEDFNNTIKAIKDGINKKKIDIVEKEEIFNFAKKDGEWKLIIK